MKKGLQIGVVFALVLSALGFMMFREEPVEEVPEEDRIKVVATIFPLYDIVGEVIGDRSHVTLMLPAGASPHTFSPKPQMIQEVYDADLVFMIGGVDDWMLPFAESEEKEIARVDVGIPYLYMEEHDHGNGHEEGYENPPAGREDEDMLPDPHYWLSVENAVIIASNVAAELSRIDPLNEAVYLENAARYRLELADLDIQMKRELAGLDTHPVLMFHGGWNYFAEQYGVHIAGVFEVTPGKDMLPQDIEHLYEVVEEEGVVALFTEPQLASDTHESFVEDLGIQVYTLDPIGGVPGRESYIELMQYNTEIMQTALGNI